MDAFWEPIKLQTRNNNAFQIPMRRLLCIAVLAFLSGCRSHDGLPRVEVRGNVVYEGVPVKHGMIVFRPASKSKGPSAGAAIVDGRFVLAADKGPTPGPHDVEVKIVDAPAEPATANEADRALRRAGQLKSFTQQVEIKSGLNECQFSFASAALSPATNSSQ